MAQDDLYEKRESCDKLKGIIGRNVIFGAGTQRKGEIWGIYNRIHNMALQRIDHGLALQGVKPGLQTGIYYYTCLTCNLSRFEQGISLAV